VKAEQALLATHDQAVALAGKPAEANALWDGLLAQYKDTCLATRIQRLLDGVKG
jgi:hypothetical protein